MGRAGRLLLVYIYMYYKTCRNCIIMALLYYFAAFQAIFVNVFELYG